jgi:hypothetical protein
MTHDDARLLLSAVADGEASGTPELDAHLASCAGCAAYADGLARLSVLTAALPRPAAPADLPARVTWRIRRRRWTRRLVPALVAATAAAVVLTTLPGPSTPLFPLPPAAAAEPLLTLRSLYVLRTVTSGDVSVREEVWWRAPGSVRIERRWTDPGGRYETLDIRTPSTEYRDGELSAHLPPAIVLPEPISPTVALIGTDRGPGPVVAGKATRRYDVRLREQSRTVYVADGIGLRSTESVVLMKSGGTGGTVKTTQVFRVNPDLPDFLFAAPGQPSADRGFRERPLDDLAIEPDRLPEGFAVARAGRGPEGEAFLLARGSLPVLVRTGGLRIQPTGEVRTVAGHLVVVDLYEPPAVQVTTPHGVVTVSAPLPPESLVALALEMYGLE